MHPERATAGTGEEGEPTPLEAALLAASETLFHRQVSRYRIAEAMRMAATERAIAAWGKAEQEKGIDRRYVAFLCAEHLRMARAALRERTLDYVRAIAWQKATRDGAIVQFSRNGGDGGREGTQVSP